jgi:uncharacterized protein (UPF0333 family)
MKKSTLKNKNKKKGQGSIETLLLFGGAVLLAAIVIAIIVGIGSSSKQSTEKSASSAITMSKTVIPAVLHSVTCVNTTCDVLFQSFSDGNNELVIDDDIEHKTQITDNKTTISSPLIAGSHSAYILTTLDGGSAKSNTYKWDVTAGGTTPPQTEQVATPTANPTAGTYDSAQTVTLSTTTPAAQIYYKLIDSLSGSQNISCGEEPQYYAPIQISSTKTLIAIACKEGMGDSGILTQRYVISTPTHINLTFDPQAGFIRRIGEQIIINTDPSTVDIWYTTNGSNPERDGGESKHYEGSGIEIEENFTRIKAIAYGDNRINSGVQKAEYTVEGHVADPIAEPKGGFVFKDANLTLSTTTPGARIYYTTDGTDPGDRSTQYSDPIKFSSLCRAEDQCYIKAIAILENKSNIASFDYTLKEREVATPTAIPDRLTFVESTNVQLNTTTRDAVIYYTLDESTPTNRSTKYDREINITETTTIKAIAILEGVSSGVLTVTYERSLPSNSDQAP